MDKRLVYDPNVDLSNYNTYQEPMSNYNSMGNSMSNSMSNSMGNSMSYSHNNSPQPMPPQMPQMQQPMPPQIPRQQYMNYNVEQMEQQRPKKKAYKKRSKIREICSMSTLRKILVITVLYVVVSHNKTSLFLCNNVPYVCITNALSYNVLKGIIMAIVIVLTWGFM